MVPAASHYRAQCGSAEVATAAHTPEHGHAPANPDPKGAEEEQAGQEGPREAQVSEATRRLQGVTTWAGQVEPGTPPRPGLADGGHPFTSRSFTWAGGRAVWPWHHGPFTEQKAL